ncbi:hypothetical protein BDZ89DRAFT_1138152 [Hymenopellis radicata]|nr:hypothetical protein BDZ89DRAFT_1138152 [Hymenopellis radicata]
MSDGVSTAGLEILPNRMKITDDGYPTDNLLIATSSDSWSFQHFLDRVANVLPPPPRLEGPGSKPSGPVLEMRKMLGYEGKRMHHKQHGLGAKTYFLLSCASRAPLAVSEDGRDVWLWAVKANVGTIRRPFTLVAHGASFGSQQALMEWFHDNVRRGH